MKDTGFSVPGRSIGRFATAYERDNAATGEAVVEDAPDGLGAGHRCSRAVAAGSSRPRTTTSPSPRLCSRAVPTAVSGCSRGRRVTLMTSDHLTSAQKAVSGFWPGYFDNTRWGRSG